jgi:hypothetical protein
MTKQCPYCHRRRGKLYEIQPILFKEIKLIEEVSGLSTEHILDMPLGEFLKKYRDHYLWQLKGLDDDDVYRQDRFLYYLTAMVNDMAEVTKRAKASLRDKEESGIGRV